jgi:methyltransferase (TIGR00027 family)
MWHAFSAGARAAELAEVDPDLPARMRVMVDYIASRTVFFDDFFLAANDAAADAGVRQAVILAAGLDARAWRLSWREQTTVYELDQPKVLEFKAATLQAHGARPTAALVNVAVDLRQDWPEALRRAGHDATAPTAWSAEGLLPFLSAAAQDLLFERIQALSAPGSSIAVEALAPDFFDPENLDRQRQRIQRYRAAAARLHRDDIPTVQDLWYLEERTDVGDWLRGHGWDVSVVSARQLMARHNRVPAPDLVEETPRSLFVSGQRSG